MMVKRIKYGMVRNVLTFFGQDYCTHLLFSKKKYFGKKMFALM